MQGKFGVGVPNFLSQRNPEFEVLNGATDRHYRDLCIGAEKKRAQPLSEDIHCGHLDSPQALIVKCCLFF